MSQRPSTPILPIDQYDIVIVAFSGGKDSLACLLWLLDQGVDRSKIELHHHLVDGKGDQLFDWPITESYCKAVADALGIPIYFSWKQGGFRGELYRTNAPTAPIIWESRAEGFKNRFERSSKRTKPKPSEFTTRRKFPAVAASLMTRWCSAYLKIDVMARVLNNDPRYLYRKVLVLSGERGEESKARACYPTSEPDRSDNRNSQVRRRYIDRLRPILHWTESEVWQIIEKYRIQPHPCYMIGFGRCSCAFCIFFSKNQACTAAKVLPDQAEQLKAIEQDFQFTIRAKGSLQNWIDQGEMYAGYNDKWAKVAASTEWTLPVIVDSWVLPFGAFGDSAGPV